MNTTLEAANLLGEIRDLRDRRRQQLDQDLDDINRDYDSQLSAVARVRRRVKLIQTLCLALAPVAAVLAFLLLGR
jgi:hypothetical protein